MNRNRRWSQAFGAVVLLLSLPGPTVRGDSRVMLTGVGDYNWRVGDAPTAAGMLLSYYDRNGSAGVSFSNLCAGVADLSTFSTGPNSSNTLAMIASSGHVYDFNQNGYKQSGDDQYTGRAFDCLADFMGTSQDAYGNANGTTSFWWFTDGTRLNWATELALGPAYYNDSGTYGILEYLEYRGYHRATYLDDLYNQWTDNMGQAYGFTLPQFKLEIDAGRPVMIHIANGGVLLGVGYSETYADLIYVYNAGSVGPHAMHWNDDPTYGDAQMVTVLRLIPEPTSRLLVAAGMLLLGLVPRKRGGSTS